MRATPGHALAGVVTAPGCGTTGLSVGRRAQLTRDSARQQLYVSADILAQARRQVPPLPPWSRSLERADYDPFHPPEVPRWRRQWQIWRASKSLQRLGG
ncbi:MAG TPA: hypothetical protein VJR71_13720 [Pseudolabrys sp.]|nr:hypothetical protein [Pseudolabrys sp.]